MKKYSLPLFLITLGGAILRIFQLGKHDFWYDEAWKILSSQNLYTCYLDHSSLFNFLLHFWLKLGGKNEFTLRLLPCVFGILCIPLFFLFARSLFPPSVSLWSTFILALSPLHIWYSQELRTHTLATFLLLASLILFLKAVREEKNYLWILFTITTFLSLLTLYLNLLILIPEGLYLSFPSRRKHLRKWFLCIGTVSLLSLSYLKPLTYQFIFIKQVFWPPSPTWKNIMAVWANFNLGYNSIPFNYTLSIILALPLTLLAIIKGKKRKDSLLFTLSLFLIPLFFTYLFSLWIPVFLTRQFVSFSPFYYLLLGIGWVSLPKREGKILLTTGFLLLFYFSLLNLYSNRMPSPFIYHTGRYPKRGFKSVIHYIQQNLQPGDVIAHTNNGTTAPFLYYMKGSKIPQYYFILPSYQDAYWKRNVLEWKVPSSLGLPILPAVNLEEEKVNFQRVWLISSNWARNWKLDMHSQRVREWMKEKYRVIEERWIEGVLVGLYEKIPSKDQPSTQKQPQ